MLDRLEITIIPEKDPASGERVLLGVATDALGKEIGKCRHTDKEGVKHFMGEMLDHYLEERCTQ